MASFWHQFPYIVAGVLVFLLFVLAGMVLRRVLILVGKRSRLDVDLARILASLAVAALNILGLLVTAVIVFPSFQPAHVISGLGITSVAIGFAFKDILQNFFAGILLLWRKPFRLGDQIRTQAFEGTVVAMTVSSTRLETYDGGQIFIPNNEVYTNPILVLTGKDKRRVVFEVGVGYKDDIETARSVIHKVLANTKDVFKEPEPWVYVQELAPSSVNFKVFFWIPPYENVKQRLLDEVSTGIKYALDEAGIDMPYPHRVITPDPFSYQQAAQAQPE